MQDNDTLIRELVLLTLLNKASDQISYIINDNNDARFRNLATSVFTIKQDLEDKLREDYIDAPVQTGTVPTINPTNQNPSNGNSIPSNSSSLGTPNTTSTPSGNTNGATTPNVPNSTNQMNSNWNSNASDFFDNLIAGATANNSDLADALNQLNQQENNAPKTTNGNTPF